MKPLITLRARRLETPAQRHAVGIYMHPVPGVAKVFHYMMLSIAVKLQCGVAPGQRGGE